MPKIKTSRSGAKRFKATAGGKIKRNKAFARHLMSAKTPKRKRNLRHATTVAQPDVARIKRMVPYS
ncbi:MAG: 50S ribosomal protein L35 [Candidatus Hydrogenedens sp.]|nr:50S ribosomal protein L35 [Candidatus Hydrogenedentota bacterium]NLF57420.1 50S ribosomal protein L35 [Candidatus Hydrogenedens sp.]